LELLLHQLLDENPRKRGTARGILRHSFFQAESAFTSPERMAKNEKNESVMNYYDGVPSLSQSKRTGNHINVHGSAHSAIEVPLIQHNSMKNEEMMTERMKHDVGDVSSQSTVDRKEYPKTAIEERQQNNPMTMTTKILHSLPQTVDGLGKSHQIGTAGKHFTSTGSTERIQKARQGLAAAMAAAAKTSSELLRLKEKEHNLPQDVSRVDSESGNTTSSMTADTNDSESVLHYILDGRAGVMKIGSNQRFITCNQLVTSLQLLPYTDNDATKKRRKETNYKLDDFDGAQLWVPIREALHVNNHLTRLRNHSAPLKLSKDCMKEETDHRVY